MTTRLNALCAMPGVALLALALAAAAQPAAAAVPAKGTEILWDRFGILHIVAADRSGLTVAMRVAALDRPRLFEQFWRMGTRAFDVEREVIKVRGADGAIRDEPLTIRRTVHGPARRRTSFWTS